MNLDEKRAYTETLVILEALNLIDELPYELIQVMKNNSDKNWEFDFDKNLPFENQKIMRKTIVFLSTIYVTYLCNNEDEKKKLKTICLENEKKSVVTGDLNNLVSYKKERIESENIENLSLTTKKSFMSDLIKKIKNIFCKNN